MILHTHTHTCACTQMCSEYVQAHILSWGERQRVQGSKAARPSSCSALGDVSKVHSGICFPSLCFLPSAEFPHSPRSRYFCERRLMLPLPLIWVSNASTRSCSSEPGPVPASESLALTYGTSAHSQGISPCSQVGGEGMKGEQHVSTWAAEPEVRHRCEKEPRLSERLCSPSSPCRRAQGLPGPAPGRCTRSTCRRGAPRLGSQQA